MKERIVVIGAVAAGPRAACRVKRLNPDAEVIMIDKDDLISYGGCGIPYYVSGDIPDEKELRLTAFKMLKDEKFFENAKGVHTLTKTLATKIDREKKVVHVKYLDSGKEDTLPYDKLVLATGASPFLLPIPGRDLDGVFAVSNLHSAIEIKNRLARGEVGKVVIIGAGAIGLEMAEAFKDLWGVEVTVLEYFSQPLPRLLDPPLARIVAQHLKEKEVKLVVNARTKKIEGKDGKVVAVITEDGRYKCDLVIMATGVRPNSQLAREAGLAVSPLTGGIIVNERLQTSDPDIYAGGDCVEITHLISGKKMVLSSGALANRHGRIIGTNLAGGTETFRGAVGTFVMKCFDLAIASCGLSYEVAKLEKFKTFYALHSQPERAHYYPGAGPIFVEIVADERDRRVLGFQAVGPMTDGAMARVNAVAKILEFKPRLEDTAYMELAYAPPFNSALDPINVVSMVANNLADGLFKPIELDEVFKRLKENDPNTIFIDVRTEGEAAPFMEKYPGRWIFIPYDQVRFNIDKIPRDKEIVLICNTSMRAYEAARVLYAAGYEKVYVPLGGMNFVRRWSWLD
ncbi:FAD-dependent pyridine nucleotide-disulfide oxidoreductase [Thermodesulfatator indicus DSM 15286]|uniref:FAD-dependent pyridine nucleotide-disulfide oxidoreductase n=1 Tax=Thermodesulfatator indicus (strain DSM 15286 / JCM 11887 / CIR29812) TaxID=667014 RepID=F8ADZ4_THEID|nr:FAD-dependent oxidoreductase [Thermodesulfatator indicus]AEH44959.1 FAD-dependent pyridine nucleotide-disulfide oxidoreductase [Thermodesulfatator indicus DSM 15286]